MSFLISVLGKPALIKKNISQTTQNCPGCLEKIIVKDSIGEKSQGAIYIRFSALINLSKIIQY